MINLIASTSTRRVVLLALIFFLCFTSQSKAATASYHLATDSGTAVAPMQQTDYPNCQSSSGAVVSLLKSASDCAGSASVVSRSSRGRFFTLYRPAYPEKTRVNGMSLDVRLANSSEAFATIRFTLLATDPESGREISLGSVDQSVEPGHPQSPISINLQNIVGGVPAEWQLALRGDYVRGSSDNLAIGLDDLTLTVDEEVIPCQKAGLLALQVGQSLSGSSVDLTSLDQSSAVTARRYKVTAVIPGEPISIGPGVSATPYGANASEYNDETMLEITSLATGTGVIDQIQVFIVDDNDAKSIKFFTATMTGEKIYPRDVVTVEISGKGLQTFQVNLPVKKGDAIGYFDGGAYLDQRSSGGEVLYGSGDRTSEKYFYAAEAPWSLNLLAIGRAPEKTVVLFSGGIDAARKVETSGWPAGEKQLTISGRDANCGTSLEPIEETFIWSPSPSGR